MGELQIRLSSTFRLTDGHDLNLSLSYQHEAVGYVRMSWGILLSEGASISFIDIEVTHFHAD